MLIFSAYSLKLLEISSDVYKDYATRINDNSIYNYEFEVYLELEPLHQQNYIGPFYKEETIYFDKKKRLTFEGKTFIEK